MLACVIDGGELHVTRDHPRPATTLGMVPVSLRMAGICSTDLELVRGYMGFAGVPGHEFVGVALAGALAGRRVVGEINFGCGHCRSCVEGMQRHCAQRRVLGILGADGALAEEFLVPEANLHVVPPEMDDETAVFTEPVAAACEILEQLGPRRPESAVVLGDGKLGPLVAQVLAAEGIPVDLVGRHVDQLGWLEARGVRLRTIVDLEGSCELVVDCTGSADGLRQAIALTHPRGTLVLKTTVATEYHVDLASVVINEITVLGSRCGRFVPALRRLADGRVVVGPLIEARYPLTAGDRAFDHAATRGVRKILITGV